MVIFDCNEDRIALNVDLIISDDRWEDASSALIAPQLTGPKLALRFPERVFGETTLELPVSVTRSARIVQVAFSNRPISASRVTPISDAS